MNIMNTVRTKTKKYHYAWLLHSVATNTHSHTHTPLGIPKMLKYIVDLLPAQKTWDGAHIQSWIMVDVYLILTIYNLKIDI